MKAGVHYVDPWREGPTDGEGDKDRSLFDFKLRTYAAPSNLRRRISSEGLSMHQGARWFSWWTCDEKLSADVSPGPEAFVSYCFRRERICRFLWKRSSIQMLQALYVPQDLSDVTSSLSSPLTVDAMGAIKVITFIHTHSRELPSPSAPLGWLLFFFLLLSYMCKHNKCVLLLY